MGRGARGVRGIRLLEEDRLLMAKRGEGEWLLTITEKGFGKITPLHSFPIQRRGARGVLCAKLSATSGNLVAALSVGKEEEVMLITEGGFSVRLKVANTPCAGRYARGARLMQTRTSDKVVACARILKDYLE
jgi:DNA gyrase subunit A